MLCILSWPHCTIMMLFNECRSAECFSVEILLDANKTGTMSRIGMYWAARISRCWHALKVIKTLIASMACVFKCASYKGKIDLALSFRNAYGV